MSTEPGSWAPGRQGAGPDARQRSPFASSVSLSIYESLRQEILAGTIPAGTRLHQARLARSYGVSITPIREALSALTSDGFVDSNPFSGSTVHQPTLKELDDIYQLRAELMPMLVRSTIDHITPEQLQRAKALAEAMAGKTITMPWPEANRDFHLLLDSACGNGQLLATMSRLADLSRGYVALSVASSSVRQHQANDQHIELIELYKRRDAEAAIATSLRHIDETHRLVRQVFQETSQTTSGDAPDAAAPAE
jgi:DNA-binding GntR family transcriptional regulator